MGAFVDYLLQTEHALIACAAWVVLAMVKRVAPCLSENRVWLRLLPVMPTVLCTWAAFWPGLVEGTVGERVLLGIVLGAISSHVYKLVQQSLLGNDKRIRDHPSRL
jgi:hypothetical protein